MPIFIAIAAIAAVGVNAYNAYATQDYQDKSLQLQTQRLAQQGILTEAEKRLAEAQINAATNPNAVVSPRASPNPTVQASATTTRAGPDFETLLLYAAAAFFGWIVLRALFK